MDSSVKVPRTWLRRLCKFGDTILAAESRRISAESPRERMQAETDLDAAFKALFRYYLRFPFPIHLAEDSKEKAKRLISIWSRHIQRPR